MWDKQAVLSLHQLVTMILPLWCLRHSYGVLVTPHMFSIQYSCNYHKYKGCYSINVLSSYFMFSFSLIVLSLFASHVHYVNSIIIGSASKTIQYTRCRRIVSMYYYNNDNVSCLHIPIYLKVVWIFSTIDPTPAYNFRILLGHYFMLHSILLAFLSWKYGFISIRFCLTNKRNFTFDRC